MHIYSHVFVVERAAIIFTRNSTVTFKDGCFIRRANQSLFWPEYCCHSNIFPLLDLSVTKQEWIFGYDTKTNKCTLVYISTLYASCTSYMLRSLWIQSVYRVVSLYSECVYRVVSVYSEYVYRVYVEWYHCIQSVYTEYVMSVVSVLRVHTEYIQSVISILRVYTEWYHCIQSVYVEWYAAPVTSTHTFLNGELLHT